MPVVLDGATHVVRVVALKELLGEILYQFGYLLGFPAVLTLVVVDGKPGTTKKILYALGVPTDFSHFTSSEAPMISPNSPSVSFSNARISARISSSVRSGWGL